MPTEKICSRGHHFLKSSDCPTCPICWPGYKKKLQSDFPEDLSASALRALVSIKIDKLAGLTKHTETEIAGLHGIGPKGIKTLKTALKKQNLTFKEALRKE